MRNEKGQFVRGCKKSENWYNAMEKRKGVNHSMYKPEIHKKEIIECACGCGESFNKYDSRGRPRKYINGHFDKILGTVGCREHTPETIERIRKKLSGRKLKKDSEYKRTQDYNLRRKFQKQMQSKVFERDDYICQICGEKGGDLQVDHIQSWAKYPEVRFKMDNCRTVCMSCHYYLTFKRKIPKGLKWGHNFSKSHKY